MKTHTTSVLQIKAAGILLKGTGKHVIRVLGAHKEVPYPTPPPMKEEMTAPADQSIYERYYSGELAGQQDDPTIEQYYPQVPALFITSDGQVSFLSRDWS